MDKIYEQKGLMLRQAFAELPLDVSLNMKNLSNVLNTDPEAVLCLALQKGLVSVWDTVGGDYEEAKEPLVIEGKIWDIGITITGNMHIRFNGFLRDSLINSTTLNFSSGLGDENCKKFLDKEVTITIALKGGE